MRSRKQARTANSYGTHFKREKNKVKLKRIFLVWYTENVSRYFGACSEDKISAIIPNSYSSPSNEAVACWKPTRKCSTSPIEARRRWLKKWIDTSKTTSIPEISNKSELLAKVSLPLEKTQLWRKTTRPRCLGNMKERKLRKLLPGCRQRRVC